MGDFVLQKLPETIKENCDAIDDFGSGYANFENLVKLDADIIKIDGSLIKELDTNTNAHDIINAITYFAKRKGIVTVAEFVSSEAIFSEVKALGINYAQGFYIHTPSEGITIVDV